ncbi:MAG: type II secretion system protein GspG [Planctomycetes bacterium]|nr:type II secretion system protein GspG [Planctomycetota bacterium]
MDLQAPQYAPQTAGYVMVPVRESNGLGVAGFFIALFGLFIPTGIVALLGLLISLVALGRPPRGFAAMGVLIGLLGTVIWLAITIVAILGTLAVGMAALVLVAGAFMFTQPEVIEVTSDMLNVTLAVAEYEDTNDALPEDFTALGLSVSALTDPWGKPYRFQLVDDEPGFDIVSAGGDGKLGTDDDLALSGLGRVWEDAFESFGERMEELCERLERLQGTTTIGFDLTSSGRFGSHKNRAALYEAAAVAAAVADAATATTPSQPEAPPATDITEPAEPDAAVDTDDPASPDQLD